jgi:predicted dithiol-disulfide oxidoreductase (DUF899 family)
MKTPPIVSPQEWEAARQKLLVKEKEHTRAGDALAAERRRQLILYRAFYAPDVTTTPVAGGTYPERACIGCSMVADQVAHPAHLNARDTTLAFASRVTPLGRQEDWEDSPEGYPQAHGAGEWWNYHDAYGKDG